MHALEAHIVVLDWHATLAAQYASHFAFAAGERSEGVLPPQLASDKDKDKDKDKKSGESQRAIRPIVQRANGE
jgi:hypothetical protein